MNDRLPVLGTNAPRAIGERVVGCTDAGGVWHHDQPFVIVSEVDKQAWLAWNASHGNAHPIAADGVARFYEVSMD